MGPFIRTTLSTGGKHGGFSVLNFPQGTRVSVETLNSIYEMEILDLPHILIMGGIKKDGEVRFPYPVRGSFVGSAIAYSRKPNWIGQNMRLELVCEDTVFTSSLIQNAIITTVDDFVFNLNWHQLAKD